MLRLEHHCLEILLLIVDILQTLIIEESCVYPSVHVSFCAWGKSVQLARFLYIMLMHTMNDKMVYFGVLEVVSVHCSVVYWFLWY